MKRLLAVLGLFLSLNILASELPVYSGAFVNDLAEILKPEESKALTDTLSASKKASGVNFIIVTVKSLDGTTVEDFSIRLAEKWKIGRKGEDNGLIYLVAPNDHKARLEVGYGIEGKLPDGECGRLIDVAKPFYKQKNWFGGINAVVTGVVAKIGGASVPVVSLHPKAADSDHVGAGTILVALLGVFLLFAFISWLVSNGKGENDVSFIPPPPPFKPKSSYSTSYSTYTSAPSSTRSRRNDDDNSSSSSSSSDSDSSSVDTGGSFGGGGASSDW